MIVSGKVRVNVCSFVLVGDESVVVAWSRVLSYPTIMMHGHMNLKKDFFFSKMSRDSKVK